MATRLKYLLLFLGMVLVCFPPLLSARRALEAERRARPFQDPYLQKKTHDVGKAWLTMTNFGFFGNQDDDRYVSFEFPGGSHTEYLFQGAVWVGALVDGQPYVSVGAEGWAFDEEFFPGYTAEDSIKVFSILNDDPGAVSEQDFVCEYTDALTTVSDPFHTPLGLRVKQKSYAWSYSYAEDFIIIDYTVYNMRTDGRSHESMYVGLYIDADVGHISTGAGGAYAQDDITGFREISVNPVSNDTFRVEAAWIADNDGDFAFANAAPGVSGTRVVFPPLDDLSFNWWISDTDATRDWGPAWQDEFPYGIWTEAFGTPDTDGQKYYLMMNGSRLDDCPNLFDYDQEYSDAPDDIEVDEGCPEWPDVGQQDGPPNATADDIADGEDTRYLFSFGPVGNMDPNDGIYKLAPGDSAKLTIGYFAAEDFHLPNDDVHHFADFDLNARWVKDVYDNPYRDTYSIDSDGDGILDSGDGFYGEDVGQDGIPYTGDFGDGDGVMQDFEDELYENVVRTINGVNTNIPRIGWQNGRLDVADEIPDFDGPPPPDAPDIAASQFTKRGELWIRIEWSNNSFFSDDVFANTDPLRSAKGGDSSLGLDHEFFDKYPIMDGIPTDFEGYRIYKSSTRIVDDFEMLAEFDFVDREFAIDLFGPEAAARYDLGYDRGFETIVTDDAHQDTIFTSIGDSIFIYNFGPVPPNWPIYFSVTAFDHGIPLANVQSLESSPNTNMVLVWPSPDPFQLESDAKPMVVPNPYRIDVDYTNNSNKNRWDDYDNIGFSEHTRRVDFVNLPAECDIHIYTLFGDLIANLQHRVAANGGRSSREPWNMLTINDQSIASGVYLYTVENLETGKVTVDKFVVIR